VLLCKVSFQLLNPHALLKILQHPAAKGFDFSRIKFLMSGAAPLTAELNQRVVELMPVWTTILLVEI
jgi:4-coumarate--CoA ligase